MKFKLEIEMDNAAFEESQRNGEVAEILRELAVDIEDGAELRAGRTISVRDSNGNPVGQAKVTR
jgi:hypothetical protein